MYRDQDYFVIDEEKDSKIDYIKVLYTEDSQVKERFLPRTEMQNSLKNHERLNKIKIMFLRSSPGVLYRHNVVLANESTIGTNSWMAINFETKEQALNFHSYLKTFFYRYLLNLKATGVSVVASAHLLVPDLSSVRNIVTQRIGWDSSWSDEDLKVMLKEVLTESDWERISEVALSKEPIDSIELDKIIPLEK